MREELGRIVSVMEVGKKVVVRTSLNAVVEFDTPHRFRAVRLMGSVLERTIDFGHILLNGIAIASVTERHFQAVLYPTAARKAIARNV